MAINRITGPGVGLGGVQFQALAGGNELNLQGGQAYVFPAGQYFVTPGPYAQLQALDPITGIFRNVVSTPNTSKFISADGFNWRIINLTGTAIGAFLTNVGSGATSAPVVTASAGNSSWRAIWTGIGLSTAAAHVVNTTVTVNTAGTGYQYPPVVQFAPPPSGGVQATGYATLSGATIGSITVLNQGAGYVTAPAVTFVNDPRDTTGSGAVATATLTGSGQIGAILCTNQGTALTAVPTLSITGAGSAAATAVMCFSATGITTTTAGVAYDATSTHGILTVGGTVAGTAGGIVNPAVSTGLLTPRMANITALGSAINGTAGVITTTVADGGLFSAVPTPLFVSSKTVATTVAVGTVNVGATVDTSIVIPV